MISAFLIFWRNWKFLLVIFHQAWLFFSSSTRVYWFKFFYSEWIRYIKFFKFVLVMTWGKEIKSLRRNKTTYEWTAILRLSITLVLIVIIPWTLIPNPGLTSHVNEQWMCQIKWLKKLWTFKWRRNKTSNKFSFWPCEKKKIFPLTYLNKRILGSWILKDHLFKDRLLNFTFTRLN